VVPLLALLLVPSFHKDVEPILQKRCQSCHRPGEIAPMPLLTYAQTRPWAKAIREAVHLRKMPPWFADPRFGKFANDPSLSPAELDTIDAWVAGGAPEGSPADAPPPVVWPTGWRRGEPDLVLTMPAPYRVPARAVIDYQHLILPMPFTADKWVWAVEVRPSDRSLVHHAVLYVREPGDPWLRDYPRGVMFAPGRVAQWTTSDILALYTPGAGPYTCPPGMARKIPAGSDLVLQIHYTSKDTDARDQMRIGIYFAKEPPTKRVMTLQMGVDDLDIPPGERDVRYSVSGTLPHDALLLSLFPHMHLRGSAFEFEMEGEPLLYVKPFDFYWQLRYELKTPRLLHAGTRLRWTGHFDNSPANPRNPDPTAEVHWGEQSTDEMMIGFFDVAVAPTIDKTKFFKK
jgi:hypothetical protein